MPTQIEVVEAFFRRWAEPGGLASSIREWFTPETVWENVGVAVTTGIDEAVALAGGMERRLGFTTVDVDMVAIAEAPGPGGIPCVLTERIDYMTNAEGRTIASLRCMGALELEDGKILAWRDFFEPIADAIAAQAAKNG